MFCVPQIFCSFALVFKTRLLLGTWQGFKNYWVEEHWGKGNILKEFGRELYFSNGRMRDSCEMELCLMSVTYLA